MPITSARVGYHRGHLIFRCPHRYLPPQSSGRLVLPWYIPSKMPTMQPIHKGAPTAAIAAKKISIPGRRSPSGRVPLGTKVSLGIRNK